MQYADDTQLYIILVSTSASTNLDSCFVAVHYWFALNCLSLNPEKSEAIVIGASACLRIDGAVNTFSLGTNSIAVFDSVQSLDITIDSSLSFNTHINEVCKAVRHHARVLRNVRKCFSEDETKQIGASLVSVRLDYCYSVLFKT